MRRWSWWTVVIDELRATLASVANAIAASSSFRRLSVPSLSLGDLRLLLLLVLLMFILDTIPLGAQRMTGRRLWIRVLPPPLPLPFLGLLLKMTASGLDLAAAAHVMKISLKDVTFVLVRQARRRRMVIFGIPQEGGVRGLSAGVLVTPPFWTLLGYGTVGPFAKRGTRVRGRVAVVLVGGGCGHRS